MAGCSGSQFLRPLWETNLMKTIANVCAVLAVLMISAAVHAEDRAAIEAAVFDYFHGQGEASAERLNRAFSAEHASMVGVTKGDDGREQVRAWKDMSEVLSNWSANDKPEGGARDGEIIAMEIVDDRLAVVLFRYTDRFYDALTLANVNGDWKIVQKAFIAQ